MNRLLLCLALSLGMSACNKCSQVLIDPNEIYEAYKTFYELTAPHCKTLPYPVYERLDTQFKRLDTLYFQYEECFSEQQQKDFYRYRATYLNCRANALIEEAEKRRRDRWR